MAPKTVVVFGATGYIGGAALNRLVQAHPELKFTALVRNPKDNAALEALGVKAVNGSNDDLPLVQKLATEHDIVVNAADADGFELVKAVLSALASKPKDESGSRPILVQTSGTGVVVDESTGEFNVGTSEKRWNDNSVDDIKAIGENQPHRNVDLAIFAASEKREVDTYIIAPSTIYGKGRGPVRNVSQQIPYLIREAVKRRQPVHIGKGTNLWNNVHVDDLADLYLLVFDYALSGKNAYGSYSNFFWGSVGEHQWGKIVAQIGQILHKKGLVDDPTAKSVRLEGLDPMVFTANNSRTISDRGFKQLGWKPFRPSLEDALEDEVDLVLAKI